MRKLDKHIEIVSSSALGLSSMGLQSRRAALTTLSKRYSHVGVTIVNTLSDLERLVARKPDLVFLGMKFLPVNPFLGLQDPDRIWVSEYLDRFGIPNTGSGSQAHRLELNKPLAKQRVLRAGLATAPFTVLRKNESFYAEQIALTYPLFVKPTDRGGGLGVNSQSLVRNFEELHTKVNSITTTLRTDSLVEEYLPGREFSVAILTDMYSERLSVMPIELCAPSNSNGESVLSQEVKTSNTEEVRDVTDQTLRKKIVTLASDAYRALGARDYGRIDIRLDGNGVPHFLEANLIPSLISGYGSFPKACVMHMEMGYEAMILRIVALALSRKADVIAVQASVEESTFFPSGIVPEPI